MLSTDLVSFLPYPTGYSQCSYYTSCILALSLVEQVQGLTSGRTATHRNNVYLGGDNHLAYQKVVQLHELAITEKQKLRFARAMRVLGLKPYYQITELEATIATNEDDKDFWAICDQQLSDRPKVSTKPSWRKRKLLTDYIRGKNNGQFPFLSSQSH